MICYGIIAVRPAMLAIIMPNDPLDAMKARWNHIQALCSWLREEVDPLTEALVVSSPPST